MFNLHTSWIDATYQKFEEFCFLIFNSNLSFKNFRNVKKRKQINFVHILKIIVGNTQDWFMIKLK